MLEPVDHRLSRCPGQADMAGDELIQHPSATSMEIVTAVLDRPIRFHFATNAATGALSDAETFGVRREWCGKSSSSKPDAGPGSKRKRVDNIIAMPPPSQFLYSAKLMRQIESKQTKVGLYSGVDYHANTTSVHNILTCSDQPHNRSLKLGEGLQIWATLAS